MARREELWTVKVGKRIAKLKRTREQIAGLAALAEHARAVRIVKRAKALQFHGLRDTDTNEFLEGYAAACVDILSALMKGRACRGAI